MITSLVTSADLSCVQAGVCSKTNDRYRSVQSICWMPGGEGKLPNYSLACVLELLCVPAFMSVEGGDVTKLVTQPFHSPVPVQMFNFIRT